MLIFDVLSKPEIHDYTRAFNDYKSFKSYIPIGNVNVSGERYKDYLKLLFIATTMGSFSLYASVDKDYESDLHLLSQSQSHNKPSIAQY